MAATLTSPKVVRTQSSKPVVSKPESQTTRTGLLAVLLRALSACLA